MPAVLAGLTAEEAVDPMAVVGHELHRKTAVRRVVEAALSMAAVALIFAFVLPAVTDSHYSEIWHELSHLSGLTLLALTAIWVLGMLAYTGARTATLPWGLTLPLDPFFGNFGVAPPPAYGRITSIIPREHGGNMDNRALTAGCTVYFPVFNRGALFSAGDGHALQGDGEVCLTAIETSLTGTFRLTVRKDLKLGFPRAETPTHLVAMGMNEDLDDAARQALRHMIAWITESTGLPAVDAYTLCSIAADLRVTQMVDLNKGVHCMLPKTALVGPRRSAA